MSDSQKQKVGRPTKYKKEYAKQAEKLCKLGATDAKLADFFEVNESTINEWKQKHPDFSKSLKEAKQYSDEEVVKSLYKRALGYQVDEVKLEDSDTQGKKRTVTTKHVAADTTSMIFWLKNRQPDQWRDKPEPTDDDKTGEELTINFNVSEPVRDVKVTRGK